MPGGEIIPRLNPFDGIGLFTPKFRQRLNSVAEAAAWTQARAPELERIIKLLPIRERQKPPTTTPGNVFIAKITNITPIGPNKWLYDFVEVIPVTFAIKPDGITGSAKNGCEAANDGVDEEGVGVDVSVDLGTLTMLPIRFGNVVLMHVGAVDEMTVAYTFSVPNGFSVECAPPPPPLPQQRGDGDGEPRQYLSVMDRLTAASQYT